MADGGEGRFGKGGASIDALLREVLRQGGRLDPGAERLAAQGAERLRAFLTGEAPAPGAAAGAGGATVDGEVVVEVEEEAAGLAGAPAPLVRHTIPLAGGQRAQVEVPERMTRADARRIAAVLEALALDEPADGEGA